MKSILVLCCLFLLAGCSLMADRHLEWETVAPEQFPVLRAVGYAPLSLQPGQNEQHKMLMALQASKLDAYRELAEQVYGQRIDANTSLQQLLVQNDQLRASVQGVIRGARVVKSYPVGDAYATELELDFRDVYELFQAQQPERRIRHVRYY
ncbi:LPP20 family lipoprotein [Alkalimonas delamerensis]|uniref:LPP20 family lipoprotein n=1 Tax=Alkalimonas delamerensis TaxID=265981 RepID=A0ABT9GMW0_9GAMM|nr:LPP20 family lipoprotein [Alkalimonas delamerensis]MDP4528302.1 LPP20 family lipoprotein [Alkalimonas delamerensis]